MSENWNVYNGDGPGVNNLNRHLNDHFREKLKREKEMLQQNNTFWLVWNPNGRQPLVRHPTEEVARREAERLARKHPGDTFYVLQAMDVCWLQDVAWLSGYQWEPPF
ncbi:MAG: hypothetical protein RBS34_12870 [Desulfofustis sp.]|jgi:hypothetical protein|nr:hypothetical protein [Desulfofustis sp.]